MGIQNYSIMIGLPVGNCDGADGDLEDEISGARTVTEMWSTETTIGISLATPKGDSLELGTKYGFSKSTALMLQHTIHVTIPPGVQVRPDGGLKARGLTSMQRVLTAKVSFNTSQGNLRVGSE